MALKYLFIGYSSNSFSTKIGKCLSFMACLMLFFSCAHPMQLKDAATFDDSTRVFNDTTQYRLRFIKTGYASWYGDEWNGRLTHSGDTFYTWKYTAASATIPMGSLLKVTNLRNGLFIYVKVNDTFPPWNRRSLDLSKSAAIKLDMIDEGVEKVKIELIEPVSRRE